MCRSPYKKKFKKKLKFSTLNVLLIIFLPCIRYISITLYDILSKKFIFILFYRNSRYHCFVPYRISLFYCTYLGSWQVAKVLEFAVLWLLSNISIVFRGKVTLKFLTLSFFLSPLASCGPSTH
jgi:hypothetical protein